MIREFVVGVPVIEFQRWLRRENMQLIRLIPRSRLDGVEAFVALYIKVPGRA